MDNHAEPLPVARRENFVRLVVAGRNQSDAYREAYPNARAWKDSTVRVKASQLANRPEVSARILALKREAASEAVATAREVQEVLTRQLREADKCGDWRAVVASGKLLADVCGFNAPIREERTITAAPPAPDGEKRTRVLLSLLAAAAEGVAGAEDGLAAFEALFPTPPAERLPEDLTKELLRNLDAAREREEARKRGDAGAKVGEVEA